MFRRVLIPLDGSELSEAALVPLKRLLSGSEDARALLLHAAPSDSADAAEDSLARAAERVRAWPLGCEVHLVEGDPADAILSALERLNPDLIAMATHGRSGLQRLVRGSVAERVLRHATQPLLLVNPSAEAGPDGAFRRILVPLDGSPLADKILPYVIAMAQASGAEVTLIRVEPIDPYLNLPLSGVPFVQPTLWNPQAVRETIQPQLDRLLAAGVEAKIEAVIGDAAQEIVQRAHETDLVALSSHGRSGPSRWWFGSTAEQILRAVDRPVFLIRGH